MYMSRQEMREKISEVLSSIELTENDEKTLREALETVFEMEEGDISAKELQLKSQKSNEEKRARSILNTITKVDEESTIHEQRKTSNR